MTSFKNLKLQPMFATPAEPFDSEEYLFEVKWDGYRALAYLDKETRLQSRNLKDFTLHYPNLSDLYKKVKERPLILDGEIISLKEGRPSFQKLQGRQKQQVIFVAFDLLYYGGNSIIDLPLLERKKILGDIVQEDANLLLSQYIYESGLNLFKKCAEKGLEGIVAKKIYSPYLPGKRVRFWKKIKSIQEDDFVIIGYVRGKTSPVKSIALASYEEGKLVFKGLVGTGLKEDFKQQLLELFGELVIEDPPVNPKETELKDCIFLLPHLVCTVSFLEITHDNRLRHPSFKGLRYDKFAKDLTERFD